MARTKLTPEEVAALPQLEEQCRAAVRAGRTEEALAIIAKHPFPSLVLQGIGSSWGKPKVVSEIVAAGLSHPDVGARHVTAQSALGMASDAKFAVGDLFIEALAGALADHGRHHGGMTICARSAQALGRAAFERPRVRKKIRARLEAALETDGRFAAALALGYLAVGTDDLELMESLLAQSNGRVREGACTGAQYAATTKPFGVSDVHKLHAKMRVLLQRVAEEDRSAAVRKIALAALDAWARARPPRRPT